jgi:hypothetical protein
MSFGKYLITGGGEEIFITVTVSTPGIASNEVEVTFSTGDSVLIAESTDATGLVKKTSLGKSLDLVSGLVEINTRISLSNIPKADWPNCFDSLIVKYFLSGGVKDETLECETEDKQKSDSGKTLIVEKFIQLNKV